MTRDLWVMSSTQVPGYFHGVPLGRENGFIGSLAHWLIGSLVHRLHTTTRFHQG